MPENSAMTYRKQAIEVMCDVGDGCCRKEGSFRVAGEAEVMDGGGRMVKNVLRCGLCQFVQEEAEYEISSA
jgi:hypothetical protein